MSIVKIFIAMAIAVFGVALLGAPQAMSQGIREGFLVSVNVLVPALFPFMVLSSFIALTDYRKIL